MPTRGDANNATAHQAGFRTGAGAPQPGAAASDHLETMPAPLMLQRSVARQRAQAATWIEAWLPQADCTRVRPGQPARIALSGAGHAGYDAIDGVVTAVLSGDSPGVIGSPRFCRVSIRPSSAFFVGGQTYHPLLPGVSIQVMLRCADAMLTALLAAVRSRPA